MSYLTPPERICANPQCRKVVYRGQFFCKGYCKNCYDRLKRTGTLEYTRIPIKARRRNPDPPRLAWNSIAEIRLLRELCRRDFWTFFLYAFGAGRNPKGKRWIDPAVHEPMAQWFQQHVDQWLKDRELDRGTQKHLAILVHREIGKTTLLTRAGQLWLHLRDPEIATATGSEKLPLAMKMLAAMKAVLDGSDPHAMFSRLYGDWAGGSRTWSGQEIVHSARKNTSRQDPSIITFAVETSMLGAHPDAIFYDDPISYERMTSDTNWLESVNSQVSSLIPVIQSDGLTVWVGTRYADDDHFGTAFREEGIKSVTGMQSDAYQATPDGKWDLYFLCGRDENGVPTTPKVWPEDRLKSYQKTNPLRYAAQIMNDPEISEHNPLTKEQIQQCVVKPADVPWNALKFGICCDTAFWDGKSQERKDETVVVVHGYTTNGSGDVYVVEGYGSPTWRAEDLGHRLVAIVQRYRRQGRRIIGISDEVTMSGKKDAWAIALKNYFADANEPMPPFHQFNRHSGLKVQRMVVAASFWQDGHVRVVEGAPGTETLMKQMSKIGQYMMNPKLINDWADAHSDAFQPEFYNPMKRFGPQKPPYDRGARAVEVEGLDQRMFDDSDAADWLRECPRSPIR